MSIYKLHGTIAAGNGIAFRMMMSTNEEVDGDVTSYFTRKGYYVCGLQVELSLLNSFPIYAYELIIYIYIYISFAGLL